jgi:beta-glucosidase
MASCQCHFGANPASVEVTLLPLVRHEPRAAPFGFAEVPQPGVRTAMGWPIDPQALHDLLVRVHEDLRPTEVYLTGNGAAFDDEVGEDGRVHDERRVSYLREHFRAAARAIGDGVPLRGHFVWSLLDNFE